MPESRSRHRHHHPHQAVIPQHTTRKVKRSAAVVMSCVVALAGLAVAFFTKGNDYLLLVVGAIFGAVIGFFIGRSMDSSVEKK